MDRQTPSSAKSLPNGKRITIASPDWDFGITAACSGVCAAHRGLHQLLSGDDNFHPRPAKKFAVNPAKSPWTTGAQRRNLQVRPLPSHSTELRSHDGVLSGSASGRDALGMLVSIPSFLLMLLLLARRLLLAPRRRACSPSWRSTSSSWASPCSPWASPANTWDALPGSAAETTLVIRTVYEGEPGGTPPPVPWQDATPEKEPLACMVGGEEARRD